MLNIGLMSICILLMYALGEGLIANAVEESISPVTIYPVPSFVSSVPYLLDFVFISILLTSIANLMGSDLA